jgi:hypothetical protein
MRFEPYCCVPETVRTVPRAGWNPHMSAFRFDCVCSRTRTETRSSCGSIRNCYAARP